MLKNIIFTIIGIVVIGTIIPVLWPLMTATDTGVQGLVGTDAATVALQTFYPIVLVVVGLGIAAGLVFYALKKFGVMS